MPATCGGCARPSVSLISSPCETHSDPRQFAAVIAVNAPCIKPLFGRSASNGEWPRDPSTGTGGAGSHRLTVFGKSTPEGQASRRRSGVELMLEDSQSQFGCEVQGGADRVVDEEARRGMSGIQVTTVYEVKRSAHPSGIPSRLIAQPPRDAARAPAVATPEGD